MAYQALYRALRPQKFEDVLGQHAVVRTLRQQVASERISHGYLFCGCRGTGKTSIAKIMSRAINCEHPNQGDPCGECASCQSILNGSCLDVIEMDAASNSKVEEMRELLEQVIYPPQMCKYKVYIIDEVHMLSGSAFNALLKTLEEPPEHVVFILATTEPQKIPATILSRVQRFDFGRIPMELMMKRMEEALRGMNLEATPEALAMIARNADGAMRDALSILDMCVGCAEDGKITAPKVRELLGASESSFIFRFFDCLFKRDKGGLICMIDELMRNGKEPQVFLKDLSAHCRSLLTVMNLKDGATEVLGITAEEEKIYRSKCNDFTVNRLLYLLDLFMTTESTMRYASSPRIALEAVALKACEHIEGNGDTSLEDKVSELEKEVDRLRENLQEEIRKAAASLPPPEKKEGKAEPQPKAPSPVPQAERNGGGVDLSSENGNRLWKACIGRLQKTDSRVYAVIHDRVSAELKDGVLLLKPFPGNERISPFFEKFKTEILQALREEAGTELPFRMVPSEPREAVVENPRGEEELGRVFGRENVQTI